MTSNNLTLVDTVNLLVVEAGIFFRGSLESCSQLIFQWNLSPILVYNPCGGVNRFSMWFKSENKAATPRTFPHRTSSKTGTFLSSGLSATERVFLLEYRLTTFWRMTWLPWPLPLELYQITIPRRKVFKKYLDRVNTAAHLLRYIVRRNSFNYIFNNVWIFCFIFSTLVRYISIVQRESDERRVPQNSNNRV